MQSPVELKRGDFYEDCRYHPVLCVSADYEDDELVGISLLDGSIGSCSPTHCGVVSLSTDEALDRAVNWDAFAVANGLPPQPIPRGFKEMD